MEIILKDKKTDRVLLKMSLWNLVRGCMMSCASPLHLWNKSGRFHEMDDIILTADGVEIDRPATDEMDS